jgi:hypothetical protein
MTQVPLKSSARDTPALTSKKSDTQMNRTSNGIDDRCIDSPLLKPNAQDQLPGRLKRLVAARSRDARTVDHIRSFGHFLLVGSVTA